MTSVLYAGGCRFNMGWVVGSHDGFEWNEGSWCGGWFHDTWVWQLLSCRGDLDTLGFHSGLLCCEMEWSFRLKGLKCGGFGYDVGLGKPLRGDMMAMRSDLCGFGFQRKVVVVATVEERLLAWDGSR